jgi:16S rRNA (guanine966-N2)-methyltransferase
VSETKIRIIGGSLRNSRLAVADVIGLRPTPERVRETLFNWLAPMIAGARALDWFAGTGALGIEAISRGAAKVDLVESDPHLAARLQQNLERLKITEQARIYNAHAPATIPNAPYDLVFLDPPFALNAWQSCLDALMQNRALHANSLVYIEHPAQTVLGEAWVAIKAAKAASVQFGLYRANA